MHHKPAQSQIETALDVLVRTVTIEAVNLQDRPNVVLEGEGLGRGRRHGVQPGRLAA